MKAIYKFAASAAVTITLFPCSVDRGPAFVPHGFPEQANTRFLKGELGILSPRLNRPYEFIAWRYLSNLPLGADEQKALATVEPQVPRAGREIWEKARASSGVDRTTGSAYILTSKQSTHAAGVYYDNCLDAAFSTAAATLQDRKVKYPSQEVFARWVRAQDTVFANCSSAKPLYPPDPEADLSPLARSDRAYQIASAHFYAEDFELAESGFRALDLPYLAGRCMLRRYSLLGDEKALDQARAIFVQIRGDSIYYQSAQGLIGYIDGRLKPQSVFADLAARLAAPGSGAAIAGAISGSAYLMATDSHRFSDILKNGDLPEPFDWVRSFESHDSAHAIERWQQTHSAAWLTAALVNAHGDEPEAPALIEAGLHLPRTSAAFDTAAYHAIRLQIVNGDKTRARGELGPLLAEPHTLDSVDNALRAERLSVATDFADFLRWAPRHPTGYMEDGAIDDFVDRSPVLDFDSVDVLNLLTPLTKLAAGAESPTLPAYISSELAEVAWTRAFIFQDNRTADRMIPILAKANPAWAPELTRFAAATGEEKRFRGAMLILHHPALTESMTVDFRVPFSPGEWWCVLTPGTPAPEAGWASAEDKVLAADEGGRLVSSGPAQAVLAPIVMTHAAAHENDPENPEALHLLVMVTRYGCRPFSNNGVISRQAFDLLHNRFPRSPWTQRTPYWFSN